MLGIRWISSKIALPFFLLTSNKTLTVNGYRIFSMITCVVWRR